jgi:hypothetical protein
MQLKDSCYWRLMDKSYTHVETVTNESADGTAYKDSSGQWISHWVY